MYCVALIALLSCVTQAHAEDVAATDMNDQFADELMEQLANKLVDRVGASFLQNADLDDSTLAKPGHLGLPQETVEPEQEEDDRTLAQYDDQREAMLDLILGLEGGAAMKKPMAAAMKSPMASVGKAMKAKPMNEYMTKCTEARKSGAKSFVYKGKTYTASKTKTGLVVFKAK